MDILKQLNEVLGYIESALGEEICMDKIAQLACIPKDGFIRFFSYMTGMTLSEYIRRRRLTRAAFELRDSSCRVLDIAIKYGWDSADAFTKAFIRQHGITPTAARDSSKALKVYPPASLYMMIKGAKEMNFRLLNLEETQVYGVSRLYDEEEFHTKEDLRNVMWSQDGDFVPGKICDGYDGEWYGIWQNGRYTIAREKSAITGTNLEAHCIPAGTYAAFTTQTGGFAWEEIPKLRDLIFNSWLPDSGYTQTSNLEIEIYHLWTNQEERRKNRYYEIWIPVKKASK